MMKTPKILEPAVRQYQHNDCSGLVAGFDYEETIKVFRSLEDRVSELEIDRDKWFKRAMEAEGKVRALKQELADRENRHERERGEVKSLLAEYAEVRDVGLLVSELRSLVEREKGRKDDCHKDG